MTVGDLAEFAEKLIQRAKTEFSNSDVAVEVDSLITADELCSILKIKRPTLYKWQQKGYIAPVRIGGRTYYRHSDVVNINRGCTLSCAV